MLRIVVLVALAWLAAGAAPAGAAIAVDSTNNSVDTTALGTTTLSVTIVSNANGAVVLCLTATGPNLFPTSAPTFDGQAMTQISTSQTSDTFRGQTAWYRKSADRSTGARVFSATFAGANTEVQIGAVAFTGVDQTTPLSNGTRTGDTPANATSGSLAITNPANAVAVACAGVQNAGSLLSSTNTLEWTQKMSGVNSDATGQSIDTTVNPTMGFSWTNSDKWGIIGGSLNPAASGSVKHRVPVSQ